MEVFTSLLLWFYCKMSLRLPLFLWTSVPVHSITSIAVNADATAAYTGTLTGSICKWTVNPYRPLHPQLHPQFIMIPSSCSAAISLCLTVSHDQQFLVSCLHSALFPRFYRTFPSISASESRY